MLNDAVVTKGPVLIVEDSGIQKLMRTVLEKAAFEVVEASGDTAREMLARPQNRVGLLITNTPQAFLSRYPALKMLYTSSEPDAIFLRNAPPSVRFLRKPFNNRDLIRAVEDSLNGNPELR